MSSAGPIGDIDFTGNPTYCDRKTKGKAVRIQISTKKLRDLRLSKTEGCRHVVHKRHTPFSRQLLGAREDFNNACQSSALQDNDALVEVSPSSRGDVHPTTGS